MVPTVTVVESEIYQERSERLLTEEERESLRSFLGEHPTVGDVVPGLDGLRKLRWTHQRRNKGKRGGTRIIYFHATSDQMVVLLDVYSKEQKEDLTSADRKELKAALGELKAALAKNRNNRTGKKVSAWSAASRRPRSR